MSLYEFKEQDALEFAHFKGIETKRHGDELQFKICPYCGESLAGLKKTPRFCPFCSEELS